MPKVTCHYPGGYSGVREPGGNPRLLLDLAEGATAEVSEEKAAQLLRDFPAYFTTDLVAARATAPAADHVEQDEPGVPAVQDEPIEPAATGRRGTRRKS